MKILTALNTFKKITLPLWRKEIYIENSDDKIIFYRGEIEAHYSLSSGELSSSSWEEYIEPEKYLTAKEAMLALVEGKKLSKDHWGDKFIKLDDNGNLFDDDSIKQEQIWFGENLSFFIKE